MSAQTEVKAASDKFYAALNTMLNGDTGPLDGIWSHGPTVSTMHPIGGREVGWEQVKDSWDQVAKVCGGGSVKLTDQLLHVLGDMAYELGVEAGSLKIAGQQVSFEGRVTNVYQRTGDAWKLVHHHTDISKPMLDAIRALVKA